MATGLRGQGLGHAAGLLLQPVALSGIEINVLGPPGFSVVPFYPILGEGSPTKTD